MGISLTIVRRLVILIPFVSQEKRQTEEQKQLEERKREREKGNNENERDSLPFGGFTSWRRKRRRATTLYLLCLFSNLS